MIQKFTPLLSSLEAWQFVDRYGPREVSESSTSVLAGSRKREWHWAWFEHLNPQSQPPVTQFFQQVGYTYSNKTTLPNVATYSLYQDIGIIWNVWHNEDLTQQTWKTEQQLEQLLKMQRRVNQEGLISWKWIHQFYLQASWSTILSIWECRP